ncbi:hypothetical protein Hanom_Chr15g01378251 [Helianthus anomalus]
MKTHVPHLLHLLFHHFLHLKPPQHLLVLPYLLLTKPANHSISPSKNHSFL